ncbi:hypothetical protein TNCV_3318761 [Trichonephila clavipes]|nr:hypothetical protein TNCV_3318761 [Trichonephila clavipes]
MSVIERNHSSSPDAYFANLAEQRGIRRGVRRPNITHPNTRMPVPKTINLSDVYKMITFSKFSPGESSSRIPLWAESRVHGTNLALSKKSSHGSKIE